MAYIRDPYPGYRQANIIQQWQNTIDKSERLKKTVSHSSLPLPFLGQRPVSLSDQPVGRINENIGASALFYPRDIKGSDVSLSREITERLNQPVVKTAVTTEEATLQMCLAYDRYRAQMLFQTSPSMANVEVQSMLSANQQKAAQHIIDNMGPDNIKRDRNGNIISREQWIWDVSNSRFRQVVYHV
ncbi:hypothetical protein ElyMa_001679200 [Elysia marginata]|uniref:Uncharacterized protein n=1 Tax=Elysia marginata TaxID=1093978 RepID=A0AAV4JTQ1_9GAST|nr:hypothetical protein ElyMa_001679200 [Elysia marginata]